MALQKKYKSFKTITVRSAVGAANDRWHARCRPGHREGVGAALRLQRDRVSGGGGRRAADLVGHRTRQSVRSGDHERVHVNTELLIRNVKLNTTYTSVTFCQQG